MTEQSALSGLSRTFGPLSQSKFISYAQNGEDILLWRALGGVESGFYVDVGAAEPEADSVTCAFYQRGWRGINLEPSRNAFERLSAARPNDINLNVAVGDRNGMAQFFLVDGGNGLSTMSLEQRDSLSEEGWETEETQVPVLTLEAILAKHSDSVVHFLKIDAEGSERAVLAGANLRRFRPWIILVEATKPNSQISTVSQWEDLLLEADYRFVWFDGLNRFYVAGEKAELAEAFNAQPNVFDNFLKRSEVMAEADLLAERGRADSLAAELADAKEHAQHICAQREADELEIKALVEKIVELGHQTATLQAERDAWMQELFEVNRHAAFLSKVRQNLLQNNQHLLKTNEIISNAKKQVDADYAKLHELVQAMYDSTSWKFARPVRAVGKLLRRGR